MRDLTQGELDVVSGGANASSSSVALPVAVQDAARKTPVATNVPYLKITLTDVAVSH